jgi:hypothetical protein
MGTFATYLDLPDFLVNGTANVETATLVGGNTTLSGSVAAGAGALPLTSPAGFPGSGLFTAWVLDGLNSEKVLGSLSGSTITLVGGTVAAHAAGVTVCSAGTGGCLADVIARASRAVENYCRQGPDGSADRSLYAVSRVENLRGPSLRASWDTQNTLVLWPRRWPIQSVTSVSIQYGTLAPVLLNMGMPLISDGLRSIEIPYQDVATITPITFVNQSGLRSQWFVVALTYVAGACGSGAFAGVPDDIREACVLLACDLLAQRSNPLGLSEVKQGKVDRTFRNRGDQWTSMFRERAYELLDQYAADLFGVTA